MTDAVLPFGMTYRNLAARLLDEDPFNTGLWHQVDISKSPVHNTRELTDITVRCPIPITREFAQLSFDPSLPWAEDHFTERVSGVPYNPPPSATYWPYGNTARHTDGNTSMFSHTYPERFWPKYANRTATQYNIRDGVRFQYGDLMDVVNLLYAHPLTRQAYLPVWFPEDTGNVQNVRVPCSLGYHFMLRNAELSVRYFIRSVDFVRHFKDDVYMAARLTQWVCDAINRKTDEEYGVGAHMDDGAWIPGRLIMHISSLHSFVGDDAKLKEMIQ
jgi:hypothetical protein